MTAARRAAAAGAALAALACMLHASACGDPSHVYEARLYRTDRDCVATTSSVDVVEGDPPGSCAPICLLQPQADGGRAVYVSTMCGPYPFGFDTSGTDPVCPRALAAFERDDTCLVDGGSTRPAPQDAAAD